VIDIDSIIDNTLNVFANSQSRLNALSKISQEDYHRLHTKPLTPLNIKIDCDKFKEEIEQYKVYFEQWGSQFTELPRLGLAVVNQDGVLKLNDPINGSLYEWNNKHPNSSLLETDCLTSTEVLDLPSLRLLKLFDGHWCRSNILKWDNGARFMPHIDTVVPSPWIRLWGTTDANNMEICFYDKKGPIKIEPVESGRIYVIDTSLVHDAAATGPVYQFFLSVLPSAYNLILSSSKEGI